ncbi:MAG: hypothetical protein ACYC3H_01270 [Bellilinea sp.]
MVENIRFHDTVMTPYGLGVVQGQELDDQGQRGRIICSHDPLNPDFPENLRPLAFGGLWVLLMWTPADLAEVKLSVVKTRRG